MNQRDSHLRMLTAAVLGLVCSVGTSRADLLTPTQYAMPNGFGTAAGGTFNYWDRFYSGGGATSTDGAPLSGGLGDLTDGLVASDSWNLVENLAGTGPYVGWITIDPTLTFQFANSYVFETLRIHLDDSNGTGGVAPPLSVAVSAGGAPLVVPVTDPPGSAPYWLEVDLTNLGLSGDSLTVTLNRRDLWVFASEFEIAGRPTASVVPEPATLGLLSLGGIALVLRRRVWKR